MIKFQRTKNSLTVSCSHGVIDTIFVDQDAPKLIDDIRNILLDIYCLGLRNRTVKYRDIDALLRSEKLKHS